MRDVFRKLINRHGNAPRTDLALSATDLAALRQYMQFLHGEDANAYRLWDAAFAKAVWATLAIENPDVTLKQVEDAIRSLGGQEVAAEQQRRGPHHEFVPS